MLSESVDSLTALGHGLRKQDHTKILAGSLKLTWMKPKPRWWCWFKRLLPGLLLLAGVGGSAAQEPTLELPLVIRGATVVPAPGVRMEQATIIVRRGRIASIQSGVAGVAEAADWPAGAREIDGTGLFAYAGFIDGLTRVGLEPNRPSEAEERRAEGAATSITDDPKARTPEAVRHGIFARRAVENLLDLKEETYREAHAAGFTAALVAPPRAIIGGSASVVLLGDLPMRQAVLRAGVAQTGSFESPRDRVLRFRGSYPRTALGIIAHARQFFSDAEWYAEMSAFAARHPGITPPLDFDLAAWQAVRSGTPVVWEAHTADEIHRVLNLAEEFGFRVIIAGGREAWRVADRLKRLDVGVILSAKISRKPRAFAMPEVGFRPQGQDPTLYGENWAKRPFEPAGAFDAALQRRADELANAARLTSAGLTWGISGYELKNPEDLLKMLREAVSEGGLSADAALAALTTSPARLLGVADELGTIAPGQRGNLVLLTHELTDPQARVRWVVIDGLPYEQDPGARERRDGQRRGRGLRSAEEPIPEEEDDPEELEIEQQRDPAVARAPAPVGAAPAATPRPPAASSMAPAAPPTPADPLDEVYRHEPRWAIETPATRAPGIRTGGNVLLLNAYVIPVSGPDMPNTSVLVEGGKIRAIGAGLEAPPGVPVYDLTGYVLMPGIVDPHSHIALSAINEWTNSVVPEVRCEDVLRPDDPAIYWALTGGCTTIHAMHGSANTIGGQCVVLKLKYGRPAAELTVPDAPRTVKWALGENVKRPGQRIGWSGPNDPRRFPGTRMGVEATLRRALTEGRLYAQEQAEYERARAEGRDVAPLRRDLRREALADILAGRIWVNTHCYRADEVLRLLDVAEEFGIRIAVLHHALEAYRIMPEILRHGSGTATFADWWAYKIEAYDAVPHNAGMLLRAGINSALKSDSGDLMRRMHQEAAKAMKYGALTPREALALITLNGARQFGLESRLGSIEVGKDADLAVFDGHPLDTFAKCVLTLIEGEVYFRHREFDPLHTRPPPLGIKLFPALAAGPNALRPSADRDPHTSIPESSGPAATRARSGIERGGPRGDDDPYRVDGRKRSTVFVKQSPEAGADTSGTTLAIVNATLHPVSGPTIPEGTLLVRDGRIAALGPDVSVPPEARIIPGSGLHVWPGLINAATEVGLHEIGMAEVTVDTSEIGRFQPDLMAVSAFNPHSAMIEVTRAEGITSVVVLPNGPVVAGQAGLLDLAGWTLAEMLREPRLALVVNLPSMPPRPLIREAEQPFDDWDEEESESDEQIARSLKSLERFMLDARAWAAAHERGGADAPAYDPRYAAMIPYMTGKRPVFFAVNGYKPILETLLFSERLGLRPVIVGGRDAWKLADLLAKRRIPVIYEGTMSLPAATTGQRLCTEEWDAHYRALGVLERAGVQVAVCHRSADLAKLLGPEVGFAVAHGLSPEGAVRAMTLTPAEILGVEDELGSLEVGKVANVIVTTDHPGQATNVVRHVLIRGVPVDLSSKHTRDADKFSARPEVPLPPPRSDLKGPPSQSNLR